MRIGIFGGTFNPIHMGHLIAAEEIRQSRSLDRVLFVPSARPPHKPAPELLCAESRLEMARLAIQGNPAFEVSEIELERRGRSYSVETIETLYNQWGKDQALYFILGIDAFLEIDSWYAPARLIRLCHFVVMSRPGYSFQEVCSVLSGTFGIECNTTDRRIPLPAGHTLFLEEVTPIGISSTGIRRRIREGRSVKYLLPRPVESYILSNHLYVES